MIADRKFELARNVKLDQVIRIENQLDDPSKQFNNLQIEFPKKVEQEVGQNIKIDFGMKVNPVDWDTSILPDSERRSFRDVRYNEFIISIVLQDTQR